MKLYKCNEETVKTLHTCIHLGVTCCCSPAGGTQRWIVGNRSLNEEERRLCPRLIKAFKTLSGAQ